MLSNIKKRSAKPKRAKKSETAIARRDDVFKVLENVVGHDQFMQALETASDPRAITLLRMALDPAYANHSIGALCEKSGLSFKSALNIFRDHKAGEVILRLMSQLPNIVTDMTSDARSRFVLCPTCNGATILPNEKISEAGVRLTSPCYTCGGVGWVPKPGDTDARKLLLEVAGLAGRKGPIVAIQQNFPAEHSIEQSVGMVQKILAEG